ncbi:hypothetical protein BJX66DRAFT_303476 [Aspergillus keveii]|uniref:Uncharacterized protein n=1 Tax=Aspergillus keveii TaxID=714993 RepID=A0ABR4G6F4_9EURO
MSCICIPEPIRSEPIWTATTLGIFCSVLTVAPIRDAPAMTAFTCTVQLYTCVGSSFRDEVGVVEGYLPVIFQD